MSRPELEIRRVASNDLFKRLVRRVARHDRIVVAVCEGSSDRRSLGPLGRQQQPENRLDSPRLADRPQRREKPLLKVTRERGGRVGPREASGSAVSRLVAAASASEVHRCGIGAATLHRSISVGSQSRMPVSVAWTAFASSMAASAAPAPTR